MADDPEKGLVEIPFTSQIFRLGMTPNVYGDFIAKERIMRDVSLDFAEEFGGKLTRLALDTLLGIKAVTNCIDNMEEFALYPSVHVWAGELKEGDQPNVYSSGWSTDPLMYELGYSAVANIPLREFIMTFSSVPTGICQVETTRNKLALIVEKNEVFSGPIPDLCLPSEISVIPDGHITGLGPMTFRHSPAAYRDGWWYCLRLQFTSARNENSLL